MCPNKDCLSPEYQYLCWDRFLAQSWEPWVYKISHSLVMTIKKLANMFPEHPSDIFLTTACYSYYIRYFFNCYSYYNMNSYYNIILYVDQATQISKHILTLYCSHLCNCCSFDLDYLITLYPNNINVSSLMYISNSFMTIMLIVKALLWGGSEIRTISLLDLYKWILNHCHGSTV